MRYLILLLILVSAQVAEAKLFPVFNESYVCYIDSTGQIVISGELYSEFEKGKLTVNGKDLADIQFKESAYFQDGVAFVRIPYRLFGLFTIWNDYCFIDKYGKIMLEVDEPDFYSFSGGYAKYRTQTTPSLYSIINTRGEIMTVIDSIGTEDGSEPIRGDEMYFVTDFFEGKALALSKDTEGTPYRYIKEIDGELCACPEMFLEADIFSDSLAGFKKGDKWGFMDHDFEEVIEPQFDFVLPFKDGYAKVLQDKYFGLIDKKGKFTIEAKYEKMGTFSEGVIGAKEYGKWGLLDVNGNWLIKPQYNSMGDCKNGLISVEIDGKYGFINKDNKIIINPDFDYVEDFDAGLAKAWIDNELIYINTQGKRVWTILDASEHNSVLQEVKSRM